LSITGPGVPVPAASSDPWFSAVTPFKGTIDRFVGVCPWHPSARQDADGRCTALDSGSLENLVSKITPDNQPNSRFEDSDPNWQPYNRVDVITEGMRAERNEPGLDAQATGSVPEPDYNDAVDDIEEGCDDETCGICYPNIVNDGDGFGPGVVEDEPTRPIFWVGLVIAGLILVGYIAAKGFHLIH
jgi:hypothetical protein